MSDLLRDLRSSLRAHFSAPLTTAAAVAVIAVGTGANIAVFAVTYGVLMRPLPYPEASRLVILSGATPDGGDFGLPLAEIEEWQRRLRTVDGLAGYAEGELTIRGAGEPRLVRSASVTESFFDVLGVEPLRGRLDSFRESTGVAVLSEKVGAKLSRGSSLLGAGLTVSSPFRTPTFSATVSRVLWHHQPSARRLNPRVPRELPDLINQLLEKAPKHRPVNAGSSQRHDRFAKERTVVGGRKAPDRVVSEPYSAGGVWVTVKS